MKINKNKLSNNFSLASNTYDEYSTIQYQLGKFLLEKAKKKWENELHCFSLEQDYSIWDIGSATGKLTFELSNCFPKHIIKGFDISSKMINYAKKHYLKDTKIQYFLEDIEIKINNVTNKSILFVFSNATLHWLNDLPTFLRKLQEKVTKKGKFCFSLYLKNSYYEIEEVFKAVNSNLVTMNCSYNFNHVMSYLKQTGWNILKEGYIEKKLLFKNYQDFQQYQKKQGTLNALENNQNILFKEKKELLKSLNKEFSKEFFTTIYIGYFLCENS